MFLHWMTANKKEKKVRNRRADLVTEQVRDLLTKADQTLILMVRQ